MSDLRLFIRIFLYIFVPLLVAYSTYNFLHQAFLQAADPSDRKTRLVQIAPHMSFRDAAEEIRRQGIVRYGQALRLLARLKGVRGEIKPGEYQLSASMTPKIVLQVLTAGKVFERKVIVTPGMSIWQISKLIDQAGLLAETEFNKALVNPGLMARAGVAAQSFEGYLFPFSYSFSRPVTAEKIVWSMLERGEQEWPPKFSDRAQELKYSRHEMIILASIIQKETESAADYKMVSSVFHNRLDQGIKLQSEQSVIYGLKDFTGQLTEEDIALPSPYNTFVNFGLPPGPICNPGPDALEAALFPEKSSYLFFLRTGTGKLQFLTTQREFEEARRRLITGG